MFAGAMTVVGSLVGIGLLAAKQEGAFLAADDENSAQNQLKKIMCKNWEATHAYIDLMNKNLRDIVMSSR